MSTHKPVTAKSGLVGYSIGFGLSIVLTLAAYYLAVRHVDSGHEVFAHGPLLFAIMALAIAQLFVQLVFFLHMGREQRPRWNLYTGLFAVFVVLVIVFGSLWIMANLDYHHGDHNLDSKQLDKQLIEDEGIMPYGEH